MCLFALTLLAACHAPEHNAAPGANAAKPANDSLPYQATYSSRFESGSPEHAATILKAWRAFDDGKPADSRSLFADSVQFYMRDASSLSGKTDSILPMIQQWRSGFKFVRSTPHAWVSLRSTDKQENWVYIWGTEVSEDNAGKRDSLAIQESWRLDEAGKIDLMYQYGRNLPLPAPK